jgi:NADPH-dependent 2,4-dienoyl-CoA reductase/sulfur reductase-like enzyme
MLTSSEDIFAAGDVGQVLNPLTGKTVLDTLWSPARYQGQYAGLNMAGKIIEFSKQIPYNVTRLAGLTTTIIGSVGGGGRDPDMVGIARGDSESWRDASGVLGRSLIAAQSDFDVNRLRLMMGEKKLMGAFLMGDQTLSKPLQQLIIQEADITSVREQLLKPDRPLPDIISDFYNQWQV